MNGTLRTTEQHSVQFDTLLPAWLSAPGFRMLRGALLRLLGLRGALTAIERAHRLYPGEALTATVLRVLEIGWKITGDTSVIPRTGPLVVVANHPFGAAEGMVLHELIREVRRDVRTMAAHQLRVIPDMEHHFIFVDASGSRESARSNIRPMAEALRTLHAGGALALFPAGAISQYSFRERNVVDPPWSSTLGGLVRRSGAVVLPVFFGGSNSFGFKLLGAIRPRLSTVLLARELLNKRGRVLQVTIGTPIDAEGLLSFGNDNAVAAELRRRTYQLAGSHRTT